MVEEFYVTFDGTANRIRRKRTALVSIFERLKKDIAAKFDLARGRENKELTPEEMKHLNASNVKKMARPA